jgi:hypothetical protein
VGSPEEMKQLEERGVEKRIILKWVSEEWDGGK